MGNDLINLIDLLFFLTYMDLISNKASNNIIALLEPFFSEFKKQYNTFEEQKEHEDQYSD
jgi:hypothetical protein